MILENKEKETVSFEFIHKIKKKITNSNFVQICVTLWGGDTDRFKEKEIIAIKDAKITEFNNSKSVTLTTDSATIIDPDLEAAKELKEVKLE